MAKRTVLDSNQGLAADRLFSLFPSNASDEELRTLSDIEIDDVSRLLEGQNEAWSRAPRTYIVLWLIGRVDLLEDLLSSGFSDFCFPATPTSFPPDLGVSIKQKILQVQYVILTKSLDLEGGENGKHRHFSNNNPLPFHTVRKLGSGGQGQVDLVTSKISYKQYALKRIPRKTANWKLSSRAVKSFIDEMQILKSVKHNHFVEFKGSFTDSKFLGILMAPVAQMDLAEYINVAPQVDPSLKTLRSFFGCLATALQYLHNLLIRHRDIKPQNILVKGDTVLFTDFGLSRDYSGGGGTTSGSTRMTPRYAAPEVLAGSPRNFSADIWSLGCVFLEMLVVLKGCTIEWLRKDFFSNNGTKEEYFNQNIDAVFALVDFLQRVGRQQDNKVLFESLMMLCFDRKSRPTAAEIVANLTSASGDETHETTFCGLCCVALERDSDTNDSLEDLDQITGEMSISPPARLENRRGTTCTEPTSAADDSGTTAAEVESIHTDTTSRNGIDAASCSPTVSPREDPTVRPRDSSQADSDTPLIHSVSKSASKGSQTPTRSDNNSNSSSSKHRNTDSEWTDSEWTCSSPRFETPQIICPAEFSLYSLSNPRPISLCNTYFLRPSTKNFNKNFNGPNWIACPLTPSQHYPIRGSFHRTYNWRDIFFFVPDNPRDSHPTPGYVYDCGGDKVVVGFRVSDYKVSFPPSLPGGRPTVYSIPDVPHA